jgi:hypothetical protein
VLVVEAHLIRVSAHALPAANTTATIANTLRPFNISDPPYQD